MSKTHLAIDRAVMGLALATTMLAALPAYAKKTTTIEVGSCVSGLPTFATISDAITAAPKNATIEICPGNYTEQLKIAKNLTLTGLDAGGNTGAGSSLVHIVAPSGGFQANATDLNGGQPIAAQLVVSSGAVAKVIGLGFDASGSSFGDCSTNLVGVLVQNATATLQNNSVLNDTLGGNLTGCQDGEGILVESSTGAKATIAGNHVSGFDKNGITIKNATTSATVSGNTVEGGGAAAVAAQNGVEISTGAVATVSKNVIADFVYGGGTYAASSVLVYNAPKATVTGNVINEGQYAIIIYSDGSMSADNPTITKNTVAHTTLTDAVEICGAADATVNTNTISGSQLSAIHIDGTCSGSGAKAITGNRINYACAGILTGAGASGVSKNTFLNTGADVLQSDSCPGDQSRVRQARRASPRR